MQKLHLIDHPHQEDPAQAGAVGPVTGGAYTRPLDRHREVLPASNYVPAKACRQDFSECNPNQGCCLAVVAPDVAALRMTSSLLQKD